MYNFTPSLARVNIFQASKEYNIVKFNNKKNRADIGIVSAKWLSITESDVYCPPPNFPTLDLAKEHTTPSPTWRKCDVMTVLYTNSM